MRRLRLGLGLALVLGLALRAEAAVTSTPVFAQAPTPFLVQILNSSGTTQQTLVTAGANGSIVKGILASNTDTASAYSVQLELFRSAVGYLMCTVSIPISAGNVAGTAPVNLVSPTNCPGLPADGQGNQYIVLASGDSLTVNTTVAVASGKIVSVVAMGANY